MAEALEETPTLDAWEQKAVALADAFVIPGVRLAGVNVGTDRTVFERARDDGSTDDFIVI